MQTGVELLFYSFDCVDVFQMHRVYLFHCIMFVPVLKFFCKKSIVLPRWYWYSVLRRHDAAQKLKFHIKDLFSKCDQIRSFHRIWSHLLKNFSMEIFIFCAVRCMGNKMKRPVVHHNVARGTNCTTCLENFFFLDFLQNQFPWVDVALLQKFSQLN